MTAPLVSVVIPCYNNGLYLGQAIESVFAQGVSNIEVIVVDDGSTDDSAAVALSYEGVILVRQANQGAGAARDRGWAEASGTYVALLDADDWWAPGKLAAQVAELAADPARDLVYGSIEEFVSADVPIDESHSLRARPGRQGVMLPSTVLMTRAAVGAIGSFAGGQEAGEALDWALRAHEAGLNSTLVEDAVVHRRIHATNTGRQMPDAARSGYLAALKNSLDRRRAAEGADR